MNSEQLNLFIADKHTKLVDAMQKIDSNSNGIIFVTDERGSLCGAATDGDLRRWILKTGDLNAEICNAMNVEPKYMSEDDNIDPYDYMRKNVISALPVIDGDRRIKDVFLLRNTERRVKVKSGNLEGVPVIIMAGGKGTRLYPYTKILPKPLIPIDDIPIVERIISCFTEYEIKNFYMTLNYRKNMIQSYFAEIDKDYSIEYVEENEPLGTAGSIRLINDKFEKPLFVTNCDTLIKADYSDIYKRHVDSGNSITIVASMKNDVIPYGVVYAKEDGEVESLVEKPHRSYFINTGMYIIDPAMIELIPPDTFFHMTELVSKAMECGCKVGIYPISEDSFLDMGQFDEMKRMEEKLK